MDFKLDTRLKPKGDQPKAIRQLAAGLKSGMRMQTLLGVTGSGKTFTMANVIKSLKKPALVISHNKTLAAQLYSEFKELFPKNAVEYFVSYYDYYQPEAYLPATDTYIAKDASINEYIDRLRNSATRSLVERKDVIVVSSVSCIYGLGIPKEYTELTVRLHKGDRIGREEVIRRLVGIQYARNDFDFKRGVFRVRGDAIEVYPSYEERSIRVEFEGDSVSSLKICDPLTGKTLSTEDSAWVFPAKHYVVSDKRVKSALGSIADELDSRLAELRADNRLLEAKRLEQRTKYDLEMIKEMGYCTGIENYSAHFDGRKAGEPPSTLLDYFPKDSLFFIDESHVTLPQLRGMHAGDRARKENLVENGFRLPSAYDNRPLTFEEFMRKAPALVCVSATPAEYELQHSQKIVEQIIRPTGLLDPKISVRPISGQIEDLVSEIKVRVKKKERVLVTTLTKRMAEDLTEYLSGLGLKVRYLHSDVETLDRSDLLRDLRLGTFDVLVGINLLREGLDLPEVSLVAILDADKEGFLRSGQSLIQTIGRVSRNVSGEVILYADKTTDSMRKAIQETGRRRRLQHLYNKAHRIKPKTIVKGVAGKLVEREEKVAAIEVQGMDIQELEHEMAAAAERLDFETAAFLRDKIKELKSKQESEWTK